MNANTNDSFNYEASFDCSHYFGQGMGLSMNPEGYHLELSPAEVMAYAEGFATNVDEQDYSFSADRLKQFELAESTIRSLNQDYYPFNSSDLLCMNRSELEDLAKNEN